MIKLIIFDFDGVIITGSNDGYFTCYHKALEAVDVKLNPHLERQRILDYWGKGHKEQLSFLLKEHPEKIEKAIEAYDSCYYSSDFYGKIRLVAGAEKTIQELAKKYKLAIATGMMRSTLTNYLFDYELPYFIETMCYDDVEKIELRKPSPYMLQIILKRLQIKPEEAIYIGDAEGDMSMAKATGVMPIAVLTGHLKEHEAKTLGAKYVLPDITYLPNILT